MVVKSFVVFQLALDFLCLPVTLMIEDIGEGGEVALDKFDLAVTTIRNVGLTPKIGENLPNG